MSFLSPFFSFNRLSLCPKMNPNPILISIQFSFLLLVVSLLNVSSSSIGRRQYKDLNITVDCNDLDRMDRAALTMTSYGDRSNSKPRAPIEVFRDYCPKIKEASNIVKAYARTCFKPFPRQVIGLLVRGNLKEIKHLCESKEERQLFSKHSQCLKNFDPENVHKCMDRYIIDAESVRDNVHDLDLKLPYSCCAFWDFKQVTNYY